MRGKLLK